MWLQVESEGHVVNGLCVCVQFISSWMVYHCYDSPPSTCDKRPFSPTVLSSPFQGVKRPSVDKQVQ